MKKIIISSLRLNEGFTVIEILVVFSIVGVLSVLSIASFSKFNDSQVMQAAASDVYTMLNTAKSRSISQVKPSQCTSGNALEGYQVSAVDIAYELKVRCGGANITLETKKLPEALKFVTVEPVFFSVSTGNVTKNSTIAINGNGKSKIIEINQSGIISLSEGFFPPVTPIATPMPTLTQTPTIPPPTNTPAPTLTPAPDTTPPTAPTNLTGQVINDNQINIWWTASTDNVGVVAYLLYRNGVGIGAVNAATTFYSNSGLSPNTTYQYSVKAVDGKNNISAFSNTLTITTSGPTSAYCDPTYYIDEYGEPCQP